MEKLNKSSIMQAASISMFVSSILFIITVFSAQMILPSYFFETSDYYIIAILMEVLPLGIGVWLFLAMTGQGFGDIITFSRPQARMNRKNMPWLILLGALMAIVARYFIVGIQLVWLQLLEATGYNVSVAEFPAVDNTNTFIWAILAVAVTPAIFEELIFRGILQKGMLRNSKPKTAIIVSSVLFMLMHLSVENLLYTFVCGCILGYIAYRSGSILPSMAFHFVNNAIAVVLLYVYELMNNMGINMDEAADLSQYGMAETIMLFVYTIVSIVLLGLALWGFKRLSKAPPENPHLKPMSSKSIVFIVLSVCVLVLVLTFLAILQNIVPV